MKTNSGAPKLQTNLRSYFCSNPVAVCRGYRFSRVPSVEGSPSRPSVGFSNKKVEDVIIPTHTKGIFIDGRKGRESRDKVFV